MNKLASCKSSKSFTTETLSHGVFFVFLRVSVTQWFKKIFRVFALRLLQEFYCNRTAV